MLGKLLLSRKLRWFGKKGGADGGRFESRSWVAAVKLRLLHF